MTSSTSKTERLNAIGAIATWMAQSGIQVTQIETEKLLALAAERDWLKAYVQELGRDYGAACALLDRWVTPEKDNPEARIYEETREFLHPRQPFFPQDLPK